jgi:catechol 2,3-dioxygenase-like lactoylglutathione lyase family enzyme
MFIDHIGFAVTDYPRSKALYTQCLAPLGMELMVEIEGWAGFGNSDKADLWFDEDEAPQRPMHIAFVTEDRASVDQFYAAGIAAGGKDNGGPGLGSIYHPH